MKYYMAPMEGLTGYIYRNAYQKYFHDIDRYFTPFITNKKLDFKVKKDIDPEHNQGMEVVPDQAALWITLLLLSCGALTAVGIRKKVR